MAGPIPAGAMLTTTVNSLPLAVPAAAGRHPGDDRRPRIAAAINAATAADPVTGLPLNSVVSAAAAGPVDHRHRPSPDHALHADGGPDRPAGTRPGGRPRRSPTTATATSSPTPAQTLFGHQPTLCAACNLTGAEFALITAALGFGPAPR